MPDAQETDVPSIPWRLIELRLKVAALQRAEMLVRDALKRREVIGSTLSNPDRAAWAARCGISRPSQVLP